MDETYLVTFVRTNREGNNEYETCKYTLFEILERIEHARDRNLSVHFIINIEPKH